MLLANKKWNDGHTIRMTAVQLQSPESSSSLRYHLPMFKHITFKMVPLSRSVCHTQHCRVLGLFKVFFVMCRFLPWKVAFQAEIAQCHVKHPVFVLTTLHLVARLILVYLQPLHFVALNVVSWHSEIQKMKIKVSTKYATTEVSCIVHNTVSL